MRNSIKYETWTETETLFLFKWQGNSPQGAESGYRPEPAAKRQTQVLFLWHHFMADFFKTSLNLEIVLSNEIVFVHLNAGVFVF